MSLAQYLDREALADGVLKLGDFPICPECKERQGPQEWRFMRVYGLCEECVARKELLKDEEEHSYGSD